MATSKILPRAANDNDSRKVLSFGQAKVLRDLPRYMKAEAL